MTKVIINRFDGGIAQSDRPETTNEASAINGFDIFYDSYKLKRAFCLDQIDTDGTTQELNISDAIKRDTDGLIVGVGTINAGSTTLKFYSKISTISTNWVENSATMGGDVLATVGNAYMTLYKGLLYASYQVSNNVNVYKYNSDSSTSSIGSVGDYNAIMPRPLVHSQDNIMYVAGGKTIAKWDGSSWTTPAITLPYNITSMCEYGTYIAIACQAPFGGVVYLWGRDTSLTTLQDVIKVDSGKLMILENLDGILTTISEFPNDPNVSAGVLLNVFSAPMFIIRQYIGSVMQEVKRARYTSSNESGNTQYLKNYKMLKDGSLFFSTNTDHFWRFGKNRKGQYALSQDIRCAYGGRSVVEVFGMFTLGEYVYCLQRTSTGSPSQGLLVRIDSSSRNQSNQAYYITTINPLMYPEHKRLAKTLTRIGVRGYAANTSAGNIKVEYSIDNGATYVTAIDKSANFSAKLIKFNTTNNDDSTSFPEFTEIMLKVSTTSEVDVLELYYEYDLVEPLIDE